MQHKTRLTILGVGVPLGIEALKAGAQPIMMPTREKNGASLSLILYRVSPLVGLIGPVFAPPWYSVQLLTAAGVSYSDLSRC